MNNSSIKKALAIVGSQTNLKISSKLKLTSKEIKNSNEMHSRNSKNRLSKAIYEKKKKSQREKLKQYATKYYAKVPYRQNGSHFNTTRNNTQRLHLKNDNSNYVIEFLKRTNPQMFKTIRRGDLFINVGHPNAFDYGSRGHVNGIYIFNKKLTNVKLRPIDRSTQRGFEYGGIPGNFKVITQFPNPNYWQLEKTKNKQFTNLPNGKPEHYWYHYNVTIPVKNLKKSLKFTNNGQFEVNHLGLKFYINASDFYTTNDIKKLNEIIINQNEFPIKIKKNS